MDGNDLPIEKFCDPLVTAKGEPRASVAWTGLKTLWLNTGTLCNIECVNCYIESSPKNDRLVYLTLADVTPFLDEIDDLGDGPKEIGITGGEPFMAPEIIAIMDAVLARGHTLLMLTTPYLQSPRNSSLWRRPKSGLLPVSKAACLTPLLSPGIEG